MTETSTLDRDRKLPGLPAHRRIADDLRRKIESGEWPPNAMLPSRKDLAQEYGVAVGTIQQAVMSLLMQGALRADNGRGTFVADGPRPEAETPPERSLISSATPRAGQIARRVSVVGTIDFRQPLQTNLLGVATRDVLRSLERTVSAAGGRTEFANTLDHPRGQSVRAALRQLRSEGSEALVVLNVYDDPRVAEEVMAACADIPMVYVSGVGHYMPCPHVFYDQRHAGYQAAQHLLQVGFDRLLFLAPFAARWVEERLSGAQMAVQINPRPAVIEAYPLRRDIGQWGEEADRAEREMVEQVFAEGRVAGGVIACTDGLAWLVMDAAARFGKVVGRDFALVGFDDAPDSSGRGLTSIRPPSEEMGAEAARLALRMLDGQNADMQVCLHPELVPRTSTFMKRPGERQEAR